MPMSYSCNICSLETTSPNAMHTHHREHHPSEYEARRIDKQVKKALKAARG